MIRAYYNAIGKDAATGYGGSLPNDGTVADDGMADGAAVLKDCASPDVRAVDTDLRIGSATDISGWKCKG
jgi:hypothetical protein